ncbi:XF1762 family protein [Streptomyces sp. NPDC051657]|uniref:XF1762 family protein n=1 Tax=Streptomyces TaxID=1883 RepID=UPI00342AF65D
MQLHLVPIRQKDAKAFVAQWHRHHKPPAGAMFCVGAADQNGILRAVAMDGRPVPRHFDDGRTLEVTRTASDCAPNANCLLKDAHTEPYSGGELDLPSWRTFAATRGDHRLTVARLSADLWAIGHTTTTAAAVIQQDGTILADAPDSPSLAVLCNWLEQWEDAGRPAPASYSPTLTRTSGGCDLRLTR